MPRVKKGGKQRKERKKKLIKEAKGYRWQRSKKYRAAKEARLKALRYAYRDRKVRKREKRKLWQAQINAACRQHGLPYSEFVNLLKKQDIALNRKVLAELAKTKPDIFQKIVDKVKK